ncbi:MAG: alcohol dehydrogenase catalytic domain-containing protein [Dehalococcoidia bacterium]|nr:alcohol dehydrogenase catalytic domain-containing protein [Dehalococcoidia bacterium]
MRVAMWYNNQDVRVAEMPVPQVGPGEVLIRIEASGICGSDVMEWYRLSRAPLVLGHEVAGEIVATGEGVKGHKVGDRVAATHHVPCYTCHHCRSGHHTTCDLLLKGTKFEPGGFAEYVRVPAINVELGGVFPLPDEVSYEDGSFVEPLGCVLRGQRQAHLQPGQSVLVAGAGISGLLHVNLARALGAGRIVAVDSIGYRLEAALQLGADNVINADDDVPARLRELNGGRLADLVVICRAAFMGLALSSVERGGTVLFFGAAREGVTIPTPVNELFWRTELTLTSAYGAAPADCLSAIELIRAGSVRVNDMITHRFNLADSVQGFRLVSRPQAERSIKVIIEPQK